MVKWSDLEAQGIKRCCATYRSGKRCRRRATEHGYCGPHQWVHRTIMRVHNAAIESLHAPEPEETDDDE